MRNKAAAFVCVVIFFGLSRFAIASSGPEQLISENAFYSSPPALFGFALAVSGNRALVGDPQSRSVSVFIRDGVTARWNRETVLVPSAEGDLFGRSVNMRGTVAVVGGYGAAYVFVRNSSGWTTGMRLVNPGGGVRAGFGARVATDGTVVAVTSSLEGRVYLFTSDSTGRWSPYQTLTGSSGEEFGSAIAMDSVNSIAVGAANADGGSGAVYVYRYSFGSYVWALTVRPDFDARTGGRFGDSLALTDDGLRLVVGAPRETVHVFQEGAAYIFETGSFVRRLAKLRAPFQNEQASSNFGKSVAINGNDTVLIGTPRATTLGSLPVAFAFTRDQVSGEWSRTSTLPLAGVGRDDAAVAISNTIAIASAAGEGAVYPYRLETPPPAMPPSAPLNPSVTIAGQNVTLRWEAPLSGQPTTYVLEVGTQPGANNIWPGLDLGSAATTFSAIGQPGVWYVRFRAKNEAGVGPPSAEIIVRVPSS